jgi:hypothetical protein
MTVARPSTPASYFHLLRRQAYARPRRPLIVFTPKAMLRLRGATSPSRTSRRVASSRCSTTRAIDKSAVKRVLLHSGKIHWDLVAELEKNPNPEIALVRVEQLYPAPIDELNAVIDSYPNAELVWVQDEPENQGAWPFIALEVVKHLHGRTIRRVARRRGVDRDRFSEGARPRAGRDPREGSDRLNRYEFRDRRRAVERAGVLDDSGPALQPTRFASAPASRTSRAAATITMFPSPWTLSSSTAGSRTACGGQDRHLPARARHLHDHRVGVAVDGVGAVHAHHVLGDRVAPAAALQLRHALIVDDAPNVRRRSVTAPTRGRGRDAGIGDERHSLRGWRSSRP